MNINRIVMIGNPLALRIPFHEFSLRRDVIGGRPSQPRLYGRSRSKYVPHIGKKQLAKLEAKLEASR